MALAERTCWPGLATAAAPFLLGDMAEGSKMVEGGPFSLMPFEDISFVSERISEGC